MHCRLCKRREAHVTLVAPLYHTYKSFSLCSLCIHHTHHSLSHALSPHTTLALVAYLVSLIVFTHYPLLSSSLTPITHHSLSSLTGTPLLRTTQDHSTTAASVFSSLPCTCRSCTGFTALLTSSSRRTTRGRFTRRLRCFQVPCLHIHFIFPHPYQGSTTS